MKTCVARRFEDARGDRGELRTWGGRNVLGRSGVEGSKRAMRPASDVRDVIREVHAVTSMRV